MSVDNLIQGIIVQSGNDACIVVAENLAGSEEEFARLMTERARKIGLQDSTFANATGWPHPRQRMSARDLVTLAHHLYDKFPEFYPYFSQKEFTWDDITQANRNPILGSGLGVDGLKTGHTEEAGYGLVASASQGTRRVTLMITGLPSASARASEAERIMAWAFRQFVTKTVAKSGAQLGQAEVWMGRSGRVALELSEDITALVPYERQEDVRLSISYLGPLPAPITEGQRVAELLVDIPGQETLRHPLIARETVERAGVWRRLVATAAVLAERSGYW